MRRSWHRRSPVLHATIRAVCANHHGNAQGDHLSMDRQRVLITGGAGFLGINLIRHLMARGYALVSLDVEEFDYPEKDSVDRKSTRLNSSHANNSYAVF